MNRRRCCHSRKEASSCMCSSGCSAPPPRWRRALSWRQPAAAQPLIRQIWIMSLLLSWKHSPAHRPRSPTPCSPGARQLPQLLALQARSRQPAARQQGRCLWRLQLDQKQQLWCPMTRSVWPAALLHQLSAAAGGRVRRSRPAARRCRTAAHRCLAAWNCHCLSGTPQLRLLRQCAACPRQLRRPIGWLLVHSPSRMQCRQLLRRRRSGAGALATAHLAGSFQLRPPSASWR